MQPRQEFLKLLSTANLFVEGNIDEELRFSSIESGIIGTPVAKITYPKYLTRQDYSDNEIIVGTSIIDFAEKITKYVNSIEEWQPIYSEKIRRFILEKRNWDNVKIPLIKALKEEST